MYARAISLTAAAKMSYAPLTSFTVPEIALPVQQIRRPDEITDGDPQLVSSACRKVLEIRPRLQLERPRLPLQGGNKDLGKTAGGRECLQLLGAYADLPDHVAGELWDRRLNADGERNRTGDRRDGQTVCRRPGVLRVPRENEIEAFLGKRLTIDAKHHFGDQLCRCGDVSDNRLEKGSFGVRNEVDGHDVRELVGGRVVLLFEDHPSAPLSHGDRLAVVVGGVEAEDPRLRIRSLNVVKTVG